MCVCVCVCVCVCGKVDKSNRTGLEVISCSLLTRELHLPKQF